LESFCRGLLTGRDRRGYFQDLLSIYTSIIEGPRAFCRNRKTPKNDPKKDL